MVRNKIKMFAQQKVTLPKGKHKIIILGKMTYNNLVLRSRNYLSLALAPVPAPAPSPESLTLNSNTVPVPVL